jgi:dolichol kinase
MFQYLWSKCYLLKYHTSFLLFLKVWNLFTVAPANSFRISKNFFYRNLLVRVNHEGIYNRLSQRKRHGTGPLYCITLWYIVCWNTNLGPCHVSGFFLPLATIYEVKIPLRKWKKSLLQRNSAQMTWHHVTYSVTFN